MKRALALVCGMWLGLASRAPAQRNGAGGADAGKLGEEIAGLGTTARVLMIGAHPDDEDTQLIAWLAKARHVETAYLSLTRGDGGQNLIGNELGPALGMIRTEELLAARRIDGGHQYFTRAYDFGFSKTLEETLEHWPKDSILSDVVSVIRAFRPHVIISVWSGTPADGHGHHQFSGVVAREAFDAAGDTVRFPASRLSGLEAWTPSKFYRLRRNGSGSTLAFDAGEYSPLLGESFSEIATESRSQHRSQGQGALPRKGPVYSGVRLEVSLVSDANAAETGLFDGMDTTWSRFRSSPLPDSVRSALDSLPGARAAVIAHENLVDPSGMVAPLAAYERLVTRARTGKTCGFSGPEGSEDHACSPVERDLWSSLSTTNDRVTRALLDAAGVSIDITAPRDLIAQNDTVPVTVRVYNGGKSTVDVNRISFINALGMVSRRLHAIPPDSTAVEQLTYRAPIVLSLPWWLRKPLQGDMFVQPRSEMVEGEDRRLESGAEIGLRIDDVPVVVRDGPIVYRFADPARGEVRRPIAVVPEISVLLQHEVEYARAGAPFDRTMLVYVHSADGVPRQVDVSLELPDGLHADTATRHASLEAFGDAHLYFRVRGVLPAGRHEIKASASLRDNSAVRTFKLGFVPVEYSHIRPLRFYRSSSVTVQAVSVTYANLKVGYIRGVGDNVMSMLEELGLSVGELDPLTLPQQELGGYSAIVIGPRAYESNPSLVANNGTLMAYARRGGTIVTQYGQGSYGRPGIFPYPITAPNTRDRVTDENAPVRVLDPGSPLLSKPNRIGPEDFANWVQERALYMPRTFDQAYRTLFSMNDKGDPPQDGAVLIAPLGKGTYVYTTFAFFRELPAGNPGAARLFVNLLSATPAAANRPAPPPSGPVRP
jgi:LmbE family N-acetylglucosaminyl deacetylase